MLNEFVPGITFTIWLPTLDVQVKVEEQVKPQPGSKNQIYATLSQQVRTKIKIGLKGFRYFLENIFQSNLGYFAPTK